MLHLFILSILLSLSHAQNLTYSVHYQWNYLNYTWPSGTPSIPYIPKHNVIAGVKVWKDRVYLTIPRFLPGVPVTLASVPKTSDSLSPLLEPYPSWEMQREDNCSALTYVQSFEVDTEGRMWVISNGRVELWTNKSRVLCPSRLLIFDLEDNGKVLLDYAFPDSIAEPATVYLNDIVVDQEDGGYAYITDSDPQHPGLIIFSLRQGRSWKFNHPSMQLHEEAVHFIVNGTKYDTRLAINGIALSPASMKGNKLLYYCPLASFELFSVPTWVLKSRVEDIGPYVVTVGRKESQAGGMVMSSTGTLYSGLMALDGVAAWNTCQPPFTRNHHLVIQNHTVSQHPDSLAIEATGGRLWYTANRLQLYHTDTADINEPNLRVIVADIGSAKSYLYYEDGSAPEAPKIPSRRQWTLLTPLLTAQDALHDLIKSIF